MMAPLNGCPQKKGDKDFSMKRLKELPKDLFNDVEGTVEVKLQSNRLKNVNGISQLVNLTCLNLSKNELFEFPEEIKELSHLEKLNISQNNIKIIPSRVFPSLPKLQLLKMNTNRIEQLPLDLNQCGSLSNLILSNNCLKDAQALVGLPSLKELYVENNRITDLPQQLFENLVKFKGSGNPLRKPPEEVCAGGLRDIRSYFAMLKDNAETVKTVKAMFLGSSMAGKSTLCRSFERGCPVEVDEADRTVGIDIIKVESNGVRFYFWDFAGHEEYYFTHHVFITPKAFVILAIDLFRYSTDDPQSFTEQVQFWISNIQLRVPESVLLIVGTHIDQCPDEADVNKKKRDIEQKLEHLLTEKMENLKMLKRKLEDSKDPSLFLEQVLELMPIDCTRSDDVKKFQAHVYDVVKRKDLFPHIERTLPGIYQEVDNSIQVQIESDDIPKHGIVTFDDLLSLQSSQMKLDSESFGSILRYLHGIGAIVWYEKIKLLEKMVFVRPAVLISLFKAIVRHDLVKQIEDIPELQLRREDVLQKQRRTWVLDFEQKATLSNVAMNILVRRQLERFDFADEDLIKELAGNGRRTGKLLHLLQHFEVCLPTKITSPLNADAPEFQPKRKWRSSNPDVLDPDAACLFPSFLRSNDVVIKNWGSDKRSDLTVQVYFLPELPHGFFHRLIIKTCTFYPTHWVGKDLCFFMSGTKMMLLKEKHEVDPFIEIRLREPHGDISTEIKKFWEMIRNVMHRITVLTQEWPGLGLQVHSPCKETGCSDYFQWRDWKDWVDRPGLDSYAITQEETVTCRNGHTRRTELIYPANV
ncbi:malignant fibrous histiocytoma-amplified sequence 1 isoform X2 [Denticeps clupeoides]|uniref:malignant fibrous histiocytoma-amplified sequence 1 isoform X2 n=1 Tax=Denticeps clupeoides TaxID=299321 RepID=UPI0010A537FE|nr:malignant fibrous histiocytoma-amplified sequence 1-like isoform X2 [Denticeps clupeoides]